MNFLNINDPIFEGRILAKNHHAFAFLSYQPIVPGHTVICPLRPAVTYNDLTPTEWSAITDLKTKLCNALTETFNAEGFNFAWNEGAVAGQSVPHFHLHIVPRITGDSGIWQYEPRQFLYRPGSRAITPNEELALVTKLIVNNFK